MTLRRFLFVSHRYCGLVAALFLLIAGLTGCLLVFRPELDASLNADLFDVPSRPVLPAVELVRRLQQAHPDWRIRSFETRTRPGHALHLDVLPLHAGGPGVTVVGADEVFIDPFDGRVTGMRADGTGLDRRHLFATILLLHYTLLAGDAGRWFMGVIALLWLFLSVFGIWVTWPYHRPWLVRWKPAWLTSRRRLARRPMPELHRVAGLWTAILLTILACTSVAFNFYDEMFKPLVEALSPPRASPLDAPALPQPAAHQPAAHQPGSRLPAVQSQPEVGFDRALRVAIAAAASRTPGLTPVEMSDDTGHGLYGVSFAPRTDAGGATTLYEGFGRVTYYVDHRSGHVVWLDQPRLDGVGQMVLRSLYPLHSGQVAGLPTRLLVLFLGAATTGLAITGFLPWWRRRRARRQWMKSDPGARRA